MHEDQYLIVGRIRKPQGIRGEVTVELLTDEPDAVFAAGCRVFAGTVDGDLMLDASGQPVVLSIASSQPFKGGLIVKFDEIADRTGAEKWRQRYVLAESSVLTPPSDDEVYVHELIGMRVESEQGVAVGEVVATYELPQGLTLEVKTERGDILVPYRHGIVQQVDREQRALTVNVDSGLFD